MKILNASNKQITAKIKNARPAAFLDIDTPISLSLRKMFRKANELKNKSR